MAQTLQSTVSIQLHPMTPGHNGKTNPPYATTQSREEKGSRRGRRVIEPDIDPVTFLAAGVLRLLMMPNNLGEEESREKGMDGVSILYW